MSRTSQRQTEQVSKSSIRRLEDEVMAVQTVEGEPSLLMGEEDNNASRRESGCSSFTEMQ